MKMDAMTVEFIPGGVIASVGVFEGGFGKCAFDLWCFCGESVVDLR
jgi:hypothetical protein